MPRQTQRDPQYLDDDHQRISEFATDYFDDDEEREAFVDTLMERRGYKRTTGWAAPEPEPAADPGPNGQQAPPGPKRPGYFKR